MRSWHVSVCDAVAEDMTNQLPSKIKKAPIVKAAVPPLGKHLEAGQRPQNDKEWREAIAFIQANLIGIMAVCNQQAGSQASNYLSYEDNVLFWYGHLADEIMKRKNAIAEPELSVIDV